MSVELKKIGNMKWNDKKIEDMKAKILDNPDIESDYGINDENELIYKPKNITIPKQADREKAMKSIYDGLDGLGKGQIKFYYAVNKKFLIPVRETTSFLKKQGDYQITRELKITKDDEKVIALYPNQIWMIDVMEFDKTIQNENFNKNNKSFIGLYNVMDIFSRKVWSYLITKQTTDISVKVLNLIYKHNDNISPVRIISDGGATFGRKFQEKLKERNIVYTQGSPYAATSQSHIERWHRTIRTKMRSLFVRNNNLKISDNNTILKLVENYQKPPNTRKHMVF